MTIPLFPRSIRGRLLLASLFFTSLALLFASLSIGHVLDRFIRRGIDARLDAQIALLVRTVRPDGRIDRAMLEEIAPFARHRHGWGWRIEAPDGVKLTSQSLLPPTPARTAPVPPSTPARRDGGGARTTLSDGYYLRVLRRATPRGAVVLTVGAPQSFVTYVRRAAVLPLLLSLIALGLLLLAATLLQLGIGLRPLGRMKQSLAAVRAGQQARIPEDQPYELREVVAELNGLLDANEAALARARGHVSNLAHSLKTPLATLHLRLDEPGRDPNGELGALVGQIDRAIRHHLGRARAASPGAPGQPQVAIGTAIAELAQVLGRIHADRGIRADIAVAPELTVKCDPQDLDEMLGNLLDNAWKWAAARIAVSAGREAARIWIRIDDDGPGLSGPALEQALVPGRRLDERGDGHGFGLSIARELAELHGGTLHLGPAPSGGLRATLILPGP